ncbi:MAG: FtsX-like permease family protein [Saprospiraceae bacterium]
MNLLNLSWKNLWYKPLNTSLSVLLFALGVGLISLLFLLQKQLQDNFEKNLAGIDLVVGAKGSPLQLILSSMYHIDAPTGNITLKEARPFLNPKHPLIEKAIPLAMGDSYKGYRIVGTTSDLLSLYGAELASGAVWAKNFEVTLGARVAQDLHLNIGDLFQSSHGFDDNEDLSHADAHAFKVVGILQPTGAVVDQLILTTPQSFWLVHEHEEETNTEEAHEHTEVQPEPGEAEHQEVAHHHDELPKPLLEEDENKDITAILIQFKGRTNFQALNMGRSINENTDLQAATPAIEINRVFAQMDSGERVLRILALVIIIVSALSIFISLYSSLKERKYELALMRVMGAGPGKLFRLIILEGIVLAVLGYLIGILISHGGMEIIAGFMRDSYQYSFSGWQFLNEEWVLLLGTLGIGFIAAIIPAMQASRMAIAETLSQG